MSRDQNTGEYNQSKCPPDVVGLLARMEAIMSTDRQYNHAGVPTQIAIDLMRSGRVSSFTEFERWLRETGSRVHLVAVPLDFYGPEWEGNTARPIDTAEEPQYTLWTGVNGPQEAAQMLTRLGITEQENGQRLSTAGVLTVG